MSNFQLRSLVGLLLVIITLSNIYLGGIYFTAFCFIIGGFIFYEWLAITQVLKDKQEFILSLCLYLLVVTSFYFSNYVFAVIFFCFLLLLIYGFVNSRYWSAFGLLYAALPMVSLALLRVGSDGNIYLILYLFLVVWASDIGGYIFGKAIGGKKLAPYLSPNKTISGSIGSFLFSVIIAILFSYFYCNSLYLNLIWLAVILSFFVQVGDIGESAIKRYFRVKDSSNLLPGHGGFMDRFDGLIVAALILYLLKISFPNFSPL
ncbi:phosphatidate cytidylyltransferase [Bartonella sp. DGB1]|uniref:phosphatidate cytidylyltransferase n=1 Tax=Bartonella sp. DGB1 TaxID=3239807 RepID=UPI003523C799